MSGLDNLKTRLQYHGGNQEERMIKDKDRSLRRALLYSYQAETITLPDGREVRSLINPNRKDLDADQKILSVPFKCISLNKPRGTGEEEVGLQGGDVFYWNRMSNRWILYLVRAEEEAYLRADIRRCYEDPVEINGEDYYFYFKGPSETDIDWKTNSGVAAYNGLNYSAIVYIKKDENTLEYFKRFTKMTIDGRNWEVQTVNRYGGDGVLVLYLEEYFSNKYENIPEPADTQEEENLVENAPIIIGNALVKPYDVESYFVENVNGNGTWTIDNPKKAKIVQNDGVSIRVSIITGKSGSFTLTYTEDGCDPLTLEVIIQSL